jgi:hypothetical protein
MKVIELWDNPESIVSNRTYLYRKAIITWSRPKKWPSGDENFSVPSQWSGYGGLYILMRAHKLQSDPIKIMYVGKANNFNKRLTTRHHAANSLRDIKGDTLVSCGRVRFERIRSRSAYYVELEDIIKFTVYYYLKNVQGFQSLPGFRGETGRPLKPWVIINEGFRFHRLLPKRIAYPVLASF